MRGLRRVFLLSLVLVSAACYAYRPASLEGLRAGTDVRARISSAEADRLRSVLGREDRVLDGKVAGADGEGLLLSVPMATSSGVAYTGRMRQRLRIPQTEIVELEVRQLERWKTGGLVAAGALLLGLLVADQFANDSQTTDPPPTRPRGNDDLVPVRW